MPVLVLQCVCMCVSVGVMFALALVEFCVLFIWETSFFSACRLIELQTEIAVATGLYYVKLIYCRFKVKC